ncbi:MAG: hypothetical protein HZB12_00945 [Candidatus Yonathbacteria bacterium]|nr:hypothetical protein [Candidatus Yonathbacteria bacterium]
MRYLDKEGATKDKALEITDGEWRVFKQGSNPQELVDAFAGKRAFLCLGNIGDASGYLRQGDVQVYFSNNRAGKPVWPRVAIAVKPDSRAYEISRAYEMRGTYNANEDVDPEISKTDIIKERLATIPNGEAFAKKSQDMKCVTALVKKQEKGEQFTKDDLVFLYEIDALIEGFGYEKDPRIAELRAKRNPKEDAPIVLDCTPDQIATTQTEITPSTKAYIGPFFPGIFTKNIEHLYTSFPEGKIKTLETKIGGKTVEEYKAELKQKNINVDLHAESLLNSPDFKSSVESSKNSIEDIDLVCITVGDLGFENGATADEIYKKAEEFGLELCPFEVGPALRSSYSGTEWMRIAMKQISDRAGRPGIFNMDSDVDGLWLDADFAEPSRRWGAGNEFVFRARRDA